VTNENKKTLKIDENTVEIRNKYVLDTSLGHYSCAKLLGF